MTEAEWLQCVKITPMMNRLRRRGSDRQFYLAGCAAVREIGELLWEEEFAELIVLVEQFVDGLVNRETLSRKQRAAEAKAQTLYLKLHREGMNSRRLNRQMASLFAAVHAAMPEAFPACFSAMMAAAGAGKRAALWATQCGILRDIFGNPFRHVPRVDPNWLAWSDRTVPRIAQAIYDEYAFDRLPILADALEEAGCDDAAFLDHCRLPGQHVRGCWLVDMLLGKQEPSFGVARPSRTRVRQRPNILRLIRPD